MTVVKMITNFLGSLARFYVIICLFDSDTFTANQYERVWYQPTIQMLRCSNWSREH